MTGQVRYADPRQKQKAAVWNHERQVGLAGCLAPTDVGIPRRHFPGGAGEQQAGQHRAGWLRGTHEIPELCPEGHLVTEIVVALQVLSKQTAVIAVVEQLQLDGKVIADRARARSLRIAELVPHRRTRTQLLGWKLQPRQPPALVQGLQEQETFPALQASVWPAPLQQFANRVRKFGQTQRRKVARDLPNQIEFLRLQLPAAERQTTTDGHWHDASPADCRVLLLPLKKSLEIVQRNLGGPAARPRPRHFMAQRANLQSQAKACATLVPGQVLKQKKPALPGDHEVEVPIAIQVGYRNLHAASGARAVVHHVLDPFDLLAAVQADEFVPVNAQRLALARVVAVVRHVALAG